MRFTLIDFQNKPMTAANTMETFPSLMEYFENPGSFFRPSLENENDFSQ